MHTKKILLLSAVIITLAACNNVDRQECWKAKHTSLSKDCNSGGSSTLSKFTPNSKVKDKKNKSTPDTIVDTDTPDTGGDTPGTGGTNQNDPGPDTDTPEPDTNNDNPSPNEDTNTNPNPPNQNNSNDIEGYDPFGGLYGPGT